MTEIRAQGGAGWWPALVLWGTVLAVGVLYLAAVEPHRRAAQMDDRAAAAVAPVVSAPPTSVIAPAATSGPGQSQAEAGIGVVTRAAELAPVGDPEPPGPPSVLLDAPVAAAVSVPAVAPAVVAPQVTPAEARAFAEAVTEAHPVAPTQVPSQAPGQATPPAPAPQSAPTPAGAAATTPGATERARILAEYEALHRAAQQEAFPTWGGRMPSRSYTVPHYAPEPGWSRQAPGYYPGYPGR
jgi:hypothetical protein